MSSQRWLVLDLGNTAAKGGVFAGEELVRTFVLPDDPARWRETLDHECRDIEVSRAGMSSVVTETDDAAREALQSLTGAMPLVISHALDLPFTLAYETPETVGADRLAAAAGGLLRYGTAGQGMLIIDAGTAVTYEIIDAEGVLHGGAIAPGPVLLRRALRDGTAQLPEVPLEFPPSAVGQSTREALQVGVLYGLLDSVNGMIARARDFLQEEPIVVATGGWSGLLNEHLPAVRHADPHLVLYGIRDLMTKNG